MDYEKKAIGAVDYSDISELVEEETERAKFQMSSLSVMRSGTLMYNSGGIT